MISYHLLSKTGDRSNNEDNVGMYQKEDEFCFALADGLGGHGKGEVASLLAVEQSVMTFAMDPQTEPYTEGLADSFEAAQNKILEQQKKDWSAGDMKTTLVLLHIGECTIQWGHIGDSRLYHFVNNKLVERTLDHSVPQMLVSAGQIKEKQIRHHPDRNRLLRVLGQEWDEPRYQISQIVPRRGKDAFLLCTDGFWELIDEKKMQHFLKKAKTPEEWIALMEVEICKAGKGSNMDNYSAVAVWAE